jgi:hypothetical protein
MEVITFLGSVISSKCCGSSRKVNNVDNVEMVRNSSAFGNIHDYGFPHKILAFWDWKYALLIQRQTLELFLLPTQELNNFVMYLTFK